MNNDYTGAPLYVLNRPFIDSRTNFSINPAKYSKIYKQIPKFKSSLRTFTILPNVEDVYENYPLNKYYSIPSSMYDAQPYGPNLTTLNHRFYPHKYCKAFKACQKNGNPKTIDFFTSIAGPKCNTKTAINNCRGSEWISSTNKRPNVETIKKFGFFHNYRKY